MHVCRQQRRLQTGSKRLKKWCVVEDLAGEEQNLETGSQSPPTVRGAGGSLVISAQRAETQGPQSKRVARGTEEGLQPPWYLPAYMCPHMFTCIHTCTHTICKRTQKKRGKKGIIYSLANSKTCLSLVMSCVHCDGLTTTNLHVKTQASHPIPQSHDEGTFEYRID